MKIIKLASVPSTNHYLKEHCSELPDFTLVYTTNQTEGKGRLGRNWLCNGNGLAMSLLLKFDQLSPTLPLFIGLVARNALAKLLGNTEVSLKWPNDIICGNKKIGGILCESIVRGGERYYICGIGINLAGTKEKFCAAGLPHATSLLAESGLLFSTEQVSGEVENQFEQLFSEFYQSGFEPFTDEYNSNCLTIGRDVVIHNGTAEILAFAKGICEDGRLMVENQDGVFPIDAGDVSVRGKDGYL